MIQLLPGDCTVLINADRHALFSQAASCISGRTGFFSIRADLRWGRRGAHDAHGLLSRNGSKLVANNGSIMRADQACVF